MHFAQKGRSGEQMSEASFLFYREGPREKVWTSVTVILLMSKDEEWDQCSHRRNSKMKAQCQEAEIVGKGLRLPLWLEKRVPMVGRRLEEMAAEGRQRPAFQGPWWNLEYILGAMRGL